MAAPTKPLSPGMRALRVFWAGLLVSGLLFCILMAAWGDLRQGLMLKVIDDRYNKSFTVQAPQGTKVWLGTQYLGECQPHPLGVDEPEDSDVKVEGMSVLLPRVYFYEQQLEEQSVLYRVGDHPIDLLKQLAPGTKTVWVEKKLRGFSQALLRHDDGRLDFVNLVLIDLPGERRVCLFRLEHEQGHVFNLERLELWSDQICADEGGFWPERSEYNDFPPHTRGQVKTAWRWYLEVEPDAPWLKEHAPGETDVKWFKPAETD